MTADRSTHPADGSPEPPAAEQSWYVAWLMFALRYVLPVATVIGGVIVMTFGGEIDLEGGAGIISAGLAIYAVNWLYRVSFDGDRARVEEAEARAYFTAHGHWPDEAPAPPESQERDDRLERDDRPTRAGRLATHHPRSHTSLGSGRRSHD
jgi:hypothetical protein